MATKICVLFSVVVVSLFQPSYTKQCPFHLDIEPCLCTKDEYKNELDMDCSSVVDLAQLQRIFHANFPWLDYRKFTMVGIPEQPVQLTYLPDDVFGPVTFKEVIIHHTKLQRVGTYVFISSNATLKEIAISKNELVSFPTTILPDLVTLEFLDLSNNKLEFIPDLRSATLHTLDLSNNPGLSFTQQVFKELPVIMTINLNSCSMQNIMANLFLNKGNLSNLYLGENLFTTLDDDSLTLTEAIEEIILSDNQISYVNKDCFSGLNTDTYLVLLNNQLSSLPEDVWRPIFQDLSQGKGSVVLDGNPLGCGCDLAWLVTSPDLMEHLAYGATCVDNTPLHDLKPDYFINCA